jgi:hypothetical protein
MHYTYLRFLHSVKAISSLSGGFKEWYLYGDFLATLEPVGSGRNSGVTMSTSRASVAVMLEGVRSCQTPRTTALSPALVRWCEIRLRVRRRFAVGRTRVGGFVASRCRVVSKRGSVHRCLQSGRTRTASARPPAADRYRTVRAKPTEVQPGRDTWRHPRRK